MADLTVVAADVRPLPGAITARYTAGGSINVGDAVYLSGNKAVSQADGSAYATSVAIGVLVAIGAEAASSTIAASGDPVDVCLFGRCAGFTTSAGTLYFVDDDAGVIADAVGTKDCVVGVGEGSGVLIVRPWSIDVT